MFTFLFKRGRAYLSKKALTSKKKGQKIWSPLSLLFFFIKKLNGGALKSAVFMEKGEDSKINVFENPSVEFLALFCRS